MSVSNKNFINTSVHFYNFKYLHIKWERIYWTYTNRHTNYKQTKIYNQIPTRSTNDFESILLLLTLCIDITHVLLSDVLLPDVSIVAIFLDLIFIDISCHSVKVNSLISSNYIAFHNVIYSLYINQIKFSIFVLHSKYMKGNQFNQLRFQHND